jgi:hypothetical protein
VSASASVVLRGLYGALTCCALSDDKPASMLCPGQPSSGCCGVGVPPDLIPAARFFCEQALLLWILDADGRRVHACDGAGTQYRAEEGAMQGDPWGPFLWSVGYHEALLETQARHPDVTILAYLDDTYYLQRAAAAVAAMRAVTECTLRLCGVASNWPNRRRTRRRRTSRLSVVPPTVRGSTALLADGRSRGTALATQSKCSGLSLGTKRRRLIGWWRVWRRPSPRLPGLCSCGIRGTRRHKNALQVQLEMLRFCSNTITLNLFSLFLVTAAFCARARAHTLRYHARATA